MIKPIKLLHSLGLVILGAGVLSAAVAAQTAPPSPPGPPPAADQPASNPVCVRYEAQLAALNRGAADPARADQTRRYEELGCQATGGARPPPGAVAQTWLRGRRIFCLVHRTGAAMRAGKRPDPANARQSRSHDERPRTSQERQQQRSARAAGCADRAIGAEQLRAAISRGGSGGWPGRVL